MNRWWEHGRKNIVSLLHLGWERRIRTPTSGSRAHRPTVRRSPKCLILILARRYGVVNRVGPQIHRCLASSED